MRKITKDIVFAFNNGFVKKVDDTETDGISIWLHDNKIAEKIGNELWITNAGWRSNTTKERLNGLQGVKLRQKNFEWYLNGRKWAGEWVNVKEFTNPRLFNGSV